MEKRIDYDILPRDVKQAINTIYEYLPSSFLTEIRITKQHGSFCTPTSGISPSPPPDDVRAQQNVARKISRLAIKRASRPKNIPRILKNIPQNVPENIPKNIRKNVKKSLDDIGKALLAAQQIQVIPETVEEMPKTYEELYHIACNARKNDAIYAWHMLGRKLRTDEGPGISETIVSTLFHGAIPDIPTSILRNALCKARRIYDITCKLSRNQILSLKNVTAANMKEIPKKNLCKLLNYCK